MVLMKTSRWIPLTAAAFALGSGGFVHAQTGATGVHKAEDKSVMVAPFNVSIDNLEEMEIYGPGGEEVGEVDARTGRRLSEAGRGRGRRLSWHG